jgi:hypothetical protein
MHLFLFLYLSISYLTFLKYSHLLYYLISSFSLSLILLFSTNLISIIHLFIKSFFSSQSFLSIHLNLLLKFIFIPPYYIFSFLLYYLLSTFLQPSHLFPPKSFSFITPFFSISIFSFNHSLSILLNLNLIPFHSKFLH